MQFKRLIVPLLAAVFLTCIFLFQNCGQQMKPGAEFRPEDSTVTDLAKVSPQGLSLQHRCMSPCNFHSEPNSPMPFSSSNNSLAWSPQPWGPPNNCYLLSIVGATIADGGTVFHGLLGASQTWYTLPRNLRVGNYKARVHFCEYDCGPLDASGLPISPIGSVCRHSDGRSAWSSQANLNFSIRTGVGSPPATPAPTPAPTTTPSPEPTAQNSNFDYTLRVHFTNHLGRETVRNATEQASNISISYNDNNPITFTPVVVGQPPYTCTFKDPQTLNGGCLANRTYTFPPGHFPDPWWFEVKIIDSQGQVKTRRITFSPLAN